MNLVWRGKGLNEIGIDKNTNQTIIKIDKKYFRATGVDSLKGDYKRAKKILNWMPKTTCKNLVDEMTASDFNIQKNQ